MLSQESPPRHSRHDKVKYVSFLQMLLLSAKIAGRSNKRGHYGREMSNLPGMLKVCVVYLDV